MNIHIFMNIIKLLNVITNEVRFRYFYMCVLYALLYL